MKQLSDKRQSMGNYNFVETTGVIVPDTSGLQTDVQNEFIAAFGADLNVDPSTPQGVLITDETASRASLVRNNAQVANQINPNQSGGTFLDALCALLFLTRNAGTFTTIQSVTLAGVPGTVIPTTVQFSNGDPTVPNFSPVSMVTIGAGGTVSVNVTALAIGPFDVGIGTLTTIVTGTGVLGLETVTNPNASIPGVNQQSDAALKLQRNQTLALQATGLAEAMLSQLFVTPGVTSAIIRENVTGSTLVIDGVTMVAHSIYMAIDGGTDTAVATTITGVKGGGCNYNNGPGINKSIPITNPFSGQTINVLFDRPNYIPVQAQVTVQLGPSVVDPVTQIQNAIVTYANGLLDGEAGLVIGAEVSAFEFAGAITQQVQGVIVTNLQIKKVSSGSFSTASIPINIWERATINQSAIAVIIT